jgi:short-subunit dehydrogenase
MNIVLTGASKGIGFETALALVELGATSLVLISRNQDKLTELKEKCMALNKEIKITDLAVDIIEASKQEGFIQKKINLDTVDILINNAGFLINKPFEELTEPEILKMTEVNFLAPVRLIRLLMPKFRNSPLSHVLNISSMGGFQGSSKFTGLSIYSAAKAALASLTECLAGEYVKTNIRFNCLALGAVQTEMLEEAFPGYKAPVTPDKMGQYIADFALNGHKLYNGKILPVAFTNP